MDDLDRYIEKRREQDPEARENFEDHYQKFKVGVMLKMARKEARLTQTDVADKMGTNKSSISRMENKAEDMKVSTLMRYLEIVWLKMSLSKTKTVKG